MHYHQKIEGEDDHRKHNYNYNHHRSFHDHHNSDTFFLVRLKSLHEYEFPPFNATSGVVIQGGRKEKEQIQEERENFVF